MMDLYNETNFMISRIITRNYSTSFSLGISLFSSEFRKAIYAIYAYVRIADEIVDTFHDHDKRELLRKFREDTFCSIANGISTNPILHSFQQIVREFRIEDSLITAFLDSMEMDLDNSYYERKEYSNYIYGSAEAVGLMCLRVFCNRDDELYKRLEYPAKMLGSAFQKVNFLRDIRSDIDQRGRIYLPGIHSVYQINDENKKLLEKEVEHEFREALKGIARLPDGVKLGVYTAYLYYFVLLRKIQRTTISDLFRRRIRVSGLSKLILLLKSVITVKTLKLDLNETI